jgi:hypothetical protein
MNRTIYDIYAKAMLRESVEDPDSYYNRHIIKPGETVNGTTMLAAIGDVMLQCYDRFCEKFGNDFDGSSFNLDPSTSEIAVASSRVSLLDFPNIGVVDIDMVVQGFIEEDIHDNDGWLVFFETSIGLNSVVNDINKVSQHVGISNRFQFGIFEESSPEDFEVKDDLSSIAVFNDEMKNLLKERIAAYKKTTFNDGVIESSFIEKYIERLMLKMRISSYHKW